MLQIQEAYNGKVTKIEARAADATANAQTTFEQKLAEGPPPEQPQLFKSLFGL